MSTTDWPADTHVVSVSGRKLRSHVGDGGDQGQGDSFQETVTGWVDESEDLN